MIYVYVVFVSFNTFYLIFVLGKMILSKPDLVIHFYNLVNIEESKKSLLILLILCKFMQINLLLFPLK